MTYVVNFIGYIPPPRYDDVPWSVAMIGEAASPAGPFTQIDSKAISPTDGDPSEPAAHNFTTSEATLAEGWYVIIFADAFGGVSQPSDPLRNSSGEDSGQLPPTPDQVRNASPLLRQNFPAPPVSVYATADLRNQVYQSIAQIQSLTWRLIDPTLGCAAPEGYVCETVPPSLVPVAYAAVIRMTEELNVTASADYAEQLASGRMLRGFTAGPYSENYFAPGEFSRKGVMTRPPMSTDTVLDGMLWALATEDARDYFVWRTTGIAPPTGLASAFDYRKANGGYYAGSNGGPGFGTLPRV